MVGVHRVRVRSGEVAEASSAADGLGDRWWLGPWNDDDVSCELGLVRCGAAVAVRASRAAVSRWRLGRWGVAVVVEEMASMA